jgi:hypothetical protein
VVQQVSESSAAAVCQTNSGACYALFCAGCLSFITTILACAKEWCCGGCQLDSKYMQGSMYMLAISAASMGVAFIVGSINILIGIVVIAGAVLTCCCAVTLSACSCSKSASAAQQSRTTDVGGAGDVVWTTNSLAAMRPSAHV